MYSLVIVLSKQLLYTHTSVFHCGLITLFIPRIGRVTSFTNTKEHCTFELQVNVCKYTGACTCRMAQEETSENKNYM